MLTNIGQNLLNNWFSDFSRRFGEKNEGCNQNDVERAFLIAVGKTMVNEGVFSQPVFNATDMLRIEEIR